MTCIVIIEGLPFDNFLKKIAEASVYFIFLFHDKSILICSYTSSLFVTCKFNGNIVPAIAGASYLKSSTQ